MTACKPEVNPHSCDQQVVLLGDSRITEQSTVIPKTANALVGRILGNAGSVGSDGKRAYVRFLAAPGTVHRQHAQGLAAFTATCSAKERPLVIDTLGTNYQPFIPGPLDDPATWKIVIDEIDGFYAANAPQARVALQELTFDTSSLGGEDLVATQGFLDGYNEHVLRALARQKPGRYLFTAAPAAVTQGRVLFRDATHPTSSSLLAFYSDALEVNDVEGARAFDEAGLTAIERAGSACAVFGETGFSRAANSQTRLLVAQLTELAPARNPTVATWLRPTAKSPYELTFSTTTDDCTAQL